jgi:hypothetical protein
MEQVWFITSETGTDLIVSFAVRNPHYLEEIESLTLLRTPKYEHLLPPEKAGRAAKPRPGNKIVGHRRDQMLPKVAAPAPPPRRLPP